MTKVVHLSVICDFLLLTILVMMTMRLAVENLLLQNSWLVTFKLNTSVSQTKLQFGDELFILAVPSSKHCLTLV